jgi:glucose-1-phosphate thymidylyltransferase
VKAESERRERKAKNRFQNIYYIHIPFLHKDDKLTTMKAIIPVAGAGTKLRPHTYTQPKALIPLAGKTILSINVDQLHEAGINEFIFIVG